MKFNQYLRWSIVVCVVGWPLCATQFTHAQLLGTDYELPASIQQKFDSGDFTGLTQIPNLNPGVLRFDYLDQLAQEKAIFRYRVGEGSQYSESSGFSEAQEGFAWVDVMRAYTAVTALTGSHVVDLYWEQIPGFNFTTTFPSIRLYFTDSALLAGTGSAFFDFAGNPSDATGLDVQEPFVCLADDCYYRAQMNLLGLNYSQSGDSLVLGFGLSPTSDSLLLEQETGNAAGFIKSTMVVGPFSPPNLLACDVNQDGELNFLDIAPFIAVLSSGTYQAEADCNFDGEVNFFDIAPFIAVLADGN